MLNLLKRNFSTLCLFCLLVLPQLALAQSFSIDVNDGEIDSSWNNNVPAMVQNQYGYGDYIGERGEAYDIVNAWVVFDSPDPDKIYFRVDGYYIVDIVAINFDCDGDLAFTSKDDRAIVFNMVDGDEDSGGSIEGVIEYTSDYEYISDDEDELITKTTAVGEFVGEEDSGSTFQRIEAVLDISAQEKINGDMSTCFSRRGDGNWALSYQYSTDDDQTLITSQQVRTAVTLSQQAAFRPISSQASNLWIAFGFAVLGTMTFSLLYLRRKSD